jgi:hypothetical protein
MIRTLDRVKVDQEISGTRHGHDRVDVASLLGSFEYERRIANRLKPLYRRSQLHFLPLRIYPASLSSIYPQGTSWLPYSVDADRVPNRELLAAANDFFRLASSSSAFRASSSETNS